jgi:hypothetical protein
VRHIDLPIFLRVLVTGFGCGRLLVLVTGFGWRMLLGSWGSASTALDAAWTAELGGEAAPSSV